MVNHAGGTEPLTSASKSDLGSTADDSRGKGIRFVDLPLMLSFVLFLVVIAIHALVHSDQFAREGGMLDKSQLATILAVGASIVLLGYLCLAFSWKTCHGTKRNLRQQFNVALVWLLFAALVLVDIAWLSQTYPDLHPARTIGGILLVLLFLLFASPVCNRIPILRNMPNSNSLYAISMPLTAFTLCVASPISFYVSSSDFVGGVYGLTGALLALFMAPFLLLAALYLLGDKPTRNGLTLLSVFSAVSVIAYSILGVKDGGIMVQFILAIGKGLIRTNYEIAAEIVALLVMFGATSYAAIRHRQNVTYVLGAMLVTSMLVTAADIHGAKKDDAVPANKRLPVDHVDIISFSHERNVLIIMLDGFPGGYLPKIMVEVPEALREYEGFTWYRNTLTNNVNTMGSIAMLAGGPRYGVQEINNRNYDSIESAINESYSVYFDAFVPKGYQVSYANPQFAGGCDKLDKRIHCLDTLPYGMYYHDKEEPDAPLLQGDSHLPLILVMVSLFKSSPFFLKYWIYDDGGYLGTNPMPLRHAAANTAKVMEGWGFLRVLARESNADSTSKTFKFIQLNIPHGPNALNHDCKLQPEKASIFTESVCALKEIGVLLAWMKKTGIYDVTKIVVVSDHGYYINNPLFPNDFEKVLPKLYGLISATGHVQPLLLVKDFDAKGDFRRSDNFLSNSDVPSIVCSAVGGCRNVGPDPIANSLGQRRLYFAMTDEPAELTQAKQFDIKAMFEVRDSIFLPENWTRIR